MDDTRKRLGRPIEKRSRQTIEREVRAMRRLRNSLQNDERLSERTMRVAVSSLDNAIDGLCRVIPQVDDKS